MHLTTAHVQHPTTIPTWLTVLIFPSFKVQNAAQSNRLFVYLTKHASETQQTKQFRIFRFSHFNRRIGFQKRCLFSLFLFSVPLRCSEICNCERRINWPFSRTTSGSGLPKASTLSVFGHHRSARAQYGKINKPCSGLGLDDLMRR